MQNEVIGERFLLFVSLNNCVRMQFIVANDDEPCAVCATIFFSRNETAGARFQLEINCLHRMITKIDSVLDALRTANAFHVVLPLITRCTRILI